MKAVILAGGKGTRLAEHTKDIPKPMLPVGGKPMLEHQLILLKRYGITEVIILVNYLGDVIKDYFDDGSGMGMKIDYFDELEPLGTVGGVKEVEDKLQEDFIVLYGDVMINMDINRLINYHKNRKSECTLVVHPNNHPYDSDLVEMDKTGRIINVLSKGNPRDNYYTNMVNAGAYIFSPKIFTFLEKGKKADFGRDIFPEIFDKIQMFGYNTPEYLKDMGTPDRLNEVEKELLSGKIERMNFEHKRSAIFLDRDGVINHEISFIHKPEQFKLFDFTADAVKKINHSEHLAVVITNQSVIARNMCTFEELGVIHKKMETELGKERAKLDGIYYCPHHPDKGFPEERVEYKIDCECRKPKPGMLLEAANDLNIDLAKSYMIGDSERDIIAGKRAGCTTIGVRVGYGVRKTMQEPDYMFENLQQAVDFIVDDPLAEQFKMIETVLEGRNKKTILVLIGGNSRSGKSVLASYIQKNTSKKCLKISLDNWILPVEKRNGEESVYERFQLSQIETDIQKLMSGEEVVVQKYRIREEQDDEEVKYKLHDQDIIIVEGVVALSSEKLRALADLKLFTLPEESVRVERIKEFYTWRGNNDDYINKLILSRSEDEYALIEKEIKFADIIVKN